MRKFVYILLFSFIFLFSANLQAQYFEKGSSVINGTIGFGNASNYGYFGANVNLSFPAIGISYEYGILDDIGGGDGSLGLSGYVGYASYKWDGFGESGDLYNNLIIAPRAAFHYEFVDRLDTYAGLAIGAKIISSADGDATLPGGLFFDAFVGGRYYFSDNLAALAELGVGLAYLNVGVSYKLK